MKLILALLLVCDFSFAAPKKLRIMVDPGHGGDDFGARHNGVVEKDIALAIAKELHRLLKNDGRFISEITRSTDQYLSLDARSSKAEQAKSDVFVSIHANSSEVASARGTEIYFESQVPTDEESMRTASLENNAKSNTGAQEKGNSDVSNILSDLGHSTHMTYSSVLAQHILESMRKNLSIKTRAIRQAPFHVLSVSMPATLVETGFISNPKDAQWLKEPATQTKMAKAIYEGLIRYKEKLDKIPTTP